MRCDLLRKKKKIVITYKNETAIYDNIVDGDNRLF